MVKQIVTVCMFDHDGQSLQLSVLAEIFVSKAKRSLMTVSREISMRLRHAG